MSQTGLLIRAYGGFFDVYSSDSIIRCRARGKLHLEMTEPLPGDQVSWEYDANHPQAGILTEIKPRKNFFIRPNVANIDKLIFISSTARPRTDPFLIDRMSVVALHAGCEFVLCFNKTDLETDPELIRCYTDCGFRVIQTSAITGEGIDELKSVLSGSVSVLTGNSGVGKTSLLNCLIPGIMRETAQISEKHGRGKHTTRHTELFALPDSGWIADTPGFAALDLTLLADIEASELDTLFPEFPTGECRFQDCLHQGEPSCAVYDAVEAGKINSGRYSSYLRMLADIKKKSTY